MLLLLEEEEKRRIFHEKAAELPKDNL